MKIDFKWLRHQLLVVFACGLFYFALSVPFIDFLRLSETTEVRPYCVLPFFLSVVYGLPGAIGTAIGNVFSDMYYGGMDYRIYFLGFNFQLIYGYGGSCLWKYLRRRDSNIFRLDKVSKIAQYLLIILLMSIVITVMVWATLYSFYSLPFFGVGFLSTLLNHLIFFIVPGIPFFVIYSYYLQKNNPAARPADGKTYLFTLTEKFILFFLLISLIISLIVSAGAYIFFTSYNLYDQTTMWSYIYIISGITLYVCLWPTLIVLRNVENQISSPIEDMAAIGRHFGELNDIGAEIKMIKSVTEQYVVFNSEVGTMAKSFQTMSHKIEEYILKLTTISKEQTRVATQLNIARDIQNGVFPDPLTFPEADFHAAIRPALQVGGDFYDYFRIGENKVGFVIADVSGKGIPASLFMMISKIIIQQNLENGLTPGQALTKSNNEICRNNRADMFVTVFCARLDLKTGVLEYSSAGHDHPIVSINNGDFTILQNKTGFVLGEIEDVSYTDAALQLNRGDIVFVYTDGVPEAVNNDNEQFGFERMVSSLNASRDKSMKELCENMGKAIDDFSGEAQQFDDITMLAIRKN
ncbi:PP2C family protein-serine/threonine phosphatase [Succinimonas amylolytica]|uniref:PP2C family protein-serine/threonine phosphatase n=1 Tax=Succinimonas amylolytica TaxID=83769 RepID=UPI0003736E4F|nr:PP2C family protein-serine/threonine phosphatase [Succinimonas amylolytica]